MNSGKDPAQEMSSFRDRPRLIVALTCGYESRLEQLYQVVRSLHSQTKPPSELVIYLPDRFRSIDIRRLLRQESESDTTIEYVEDLGSASKLLYALEQFPDDLIVTVDDDLVYSPLTLANLYSAHLQYPEAVLANRARVIRWSEEEPELYSTWTLATNSFGNPYVLPTGVGGILYPPHIFDAEVHEMDRLRELSWTTDDLWFDIHRRRKGYPAYLVENAITLDVDVRFKNAHPISDEHLCIEIEGSQAEGLWRQNVDLKKNEKNFRNLIDHYAMGREEILAHPIRCSR